MTVIEAVIIFKGDITETRAKDKIKEYEAFLQAFSTTKKVKVEDKGIKSLAYEIQKYDKGYFVLFTYAIDKDEANKIAELERIQRIDADILKFMNVKSPEAKLEDLKLPASTPSEQKYVDLLDIIYNLA